MPYSKDNWKGNPNGRPKGSQNKFTSLKDSFIDAFKSEEINGTKGLIDWAKKSDRNRTIFYQMITKMLPSNVSVDGDMKVIINRIITEKKPDE